MHETITNLADCNERICKLKKEIEKSNTRYRDLERRHKALEASIEHATELPMLCKIDRVTHTMG